MNYVCFIKRTVYASYRKVVNYYIRAVYILTNVMVIIFALYAQKFYILMTFNSFNASKRYVFPLFRDKEIFLLSLSMTRILLYKWVINWDIEYSCFYVLFTGADNMLSQCEILGLTFRISVYSHLCMKWTYRRSSNGLKKIISSYSLQSLSSQSSICRNMFCVDSFSLRFIHSTAGIKFS